jgi:hypothetical protein
MKQFYEQTKKCGNCGFGKTAEPPVPMNGKEEYKDIKCDIDSHNHHEEYVCDNWKPKE